MYKLLDFRILYNTTNNAIVKMSTSEYLNALCHLNIIHQIKCGKTNRGSLRINE